MFTSSDTYICLYKCAWTTFVWDLYFFSDKTHAYLVAWLCAFALAVTYEGKMLFLNLEVVYLAFKVILYSEPKPRSLPPDWRSIQILQKTKLALAASFLNVKICFEHIL